MINPPALSPLFYLPRRNPSRTVYSSFEHLMDIGSHLQRVFKDLFRHSSGNVLIHKDWRGPNARCFTVRGMKNNEKNRPSAVFFEFLDQSLDVVSGDILQQEGGRTFWRVTVVEDNIVGSTFISLRAKVTNIDTPPPNQSNAVTIQGHVYGGVQVGSHGSTQNVSVAVTTVQTNVAKLRELLKQAGVSELEREDAEEALTRIETLAQKPKTADVAMKLREKLGVVAHVFSVAKGLNEVATPYLDAISNWVG